MTCLYGVTFIRKCLNLFFFLLKTILGMVGEVEGGGGGTEPSYNLFTHKKFEIGHNGNQIVDVNLTSDLRVKIQPHTKLSFSYEVNL